MEFMQLEIISLISKMVCPISSYFSLPSLPYQLSIFHWISFIVMIAVSGCIQGWLPLKGLTWTPPCSDFIPCAPLVCVQTSYYYVP